MQPFKGRSREAGKGRVGESEILGRCRGRGVFCCEGSGRFGL